MSGFFGRRLAYDTATVAPARPMQDVTEFLAYVQRRTGMLCRVHADAHGHETHVPYRLYPQQWAWLDLFDPRHVKRRALLASRDKGKSQVVTILGSAWQLYQDPSIKIAVMSVTHAQAAKYVMQIVQILRSCGCRLQARHAGFYTPANHEHTPSLIALGLGSAVRGLHFDYLIMDDPLTVNEQFSAKSIARSRYFMNEGSSIARRIILIGQLLTRDDLYYDAYGNKDHVYYLMQSWHGDIPELDKDLQYEIRAMGMKDVARNYLGYIHDEAEAIFRAIEFDESMPQGDVYGFIDPSAKGHDATAIALGWVHDARIIIQGYVLHQHWGACVQQLGILTKNCRIVYYEDNQGIALGQFLSDLGVRAVGVTSTANKIAKIYGLRGLVLQDRLRLSNRMDAQAVMLVKNWSAHAQQHDLPDAIAMLVHKIGWKIWR